jgi:hypothetical protein
MKRDFNLIRRIMADIENMPAGTHYSDIGYLTEYDPAIVYAHIELYRSGLIQPLYKLFSTTSSSEHFKT